jgi:hypothetical protein
MKGATKLMRLKHGFICRYPTEDELKLIYSTYLRSIFAVSLSKHPKWSSQSNVSQLAASMVKVYMQVFT